MSDALPPRPPTVEIVRSYAPAVQRRLDAWNAATTLPVLDYAQKIVERADSWTNVLTGVGTSRDKTVATCFEPNGQLAFGTLEALYHDDDMAARICDAIPEAMLREGYEITASDRDAAGNLMNFLDGLGVDEAFVEGPTWANVYGGSAAFVGANDGQDPSQPLDETRIQSIDFLNVLDRYSLFPNTWYEDPAAPKFGMPSTYRILTPSVLGPIVQVGMVNAVVHESRLILFRGARTSLRRRRANLGWDDSVLQRVYQVLQMFSMNWASVAQLMADASQGVYSIKGLFDMISGNNKDLLLERMKTIDMARSSGRMILTDADGESFERKATPFGGIPEILDKTAARLSAAAGMPMTILFGVSPAGLNATGESDVRGWYDKIASKREQYLRPRLERLIRLCMLAKNGPTKGKELDGWSLCFPPLWQMSATEQADVRLKTAQTDQIYIDKSVVTAEEIATSRFTDDGWSSETKIARDAREELMSTDKIAEELGKAKEPEPAPVVTPPGTPPAEQPPRS